MLSEPSIKISCRNVWKVYRRGSGKNQIAIPSGVDPRQHADTLRTQGDIVAAANVSFDILEGEIFVIMGLSGSGKSTLLRCMSRLVEPSAGEILLDGQNLLNASRAELTEIRRHKMGMVFQNFGLLPHLSVIDNVAFPLRAQGISLETRLARAHEVIDLVGLKGREHSYPHELSGGQQQRVGIARSLVVKPDIWFLDEPFSALDPLIRTQMQDEFLNIQRSLNKTIIFVTHDILEALRLADRICIMKDGEVVQIGTPSEIVLTPADAYVRKFTADVPLAQILRVDAIMTRAAAHQPGDKTIVNTATLGAAIKLFDGTVETLSVVDKTGVVLGNLNALQIIRALDQAPDDPADKTADNTADNTDELLSA